MNENLNNITNTWENVTRVLYTLTAPNSPYYSEIVYQFWDNIASDWVNQSKMETSYTAANQTSEITSFDWVNNAWVFIAKSNYTYSSNNKLTESLSSYWVNNAWQNRTKVSYSYNANNLQEFKFSDYWDSGSSLWIPNNKESIFYTSFNRDAFGYQNFGTLTPLHGNRLTEQIFFMMVIKDLHKVFETSGITILITGCHMTEILQAMMHKTI